MTNPSIEDIKGRLDIAQLISDSGREVTYSRNIRCPFHDDTTPSMRLYQDGHFHCFACGAHGDSLDWVGYLLFGQGYDPSKHLREVIDHLGGLGIEKLPWLPPRATPIKRPKVAARQMGERAMQYHAAQADHSSAYWHERGLTDETITKFALGWDGRTQRYTIPAIYRGLCFGIKKRRSLHEERQPEKYLQEYGSRVGLFNSDALNATDWVVIVEGEIDCMTMDQWGYPSVTTTGGAGTFRPHWARFFAHCRNVYYLGDNDEAGRAGALLVRRVLPRLIIKSLPDGYKDVNQFQMSGGEMSRLLI